jgi:hypothetical protein
MQEHLPVVRGFARPAALRRSSRGPIATDEQIASIASRHVCGVSEARENIANARSHEQVVSVESPKPADA